MDKKKHGGSRVNSGRKSKAEEQSLIEKLTPIDPEAIKQLLQAVKDGEKWAVELFFKYYYGLPKQVIDQTIKSEDNDITISIVKPKNGDTSDK